MTETKIPYTQDPLWQRIAAHSFDDTQATLPFSRKLAKQQNWSNSFTEKAISEYRKFVYLCCISPRGASPSPIVDEVWHLHLTYTVDYWEKFCRQTLRRDLHHHPSRGGPDEQDKHRHWYSDTLQLYENVFGHRPSPSIWPPPVTAEQPLPDLQPDPKRHRILLLLLIPFVANPLLFQKWNPYALTGPQFLVFYFLLASAAYFILQQSWQQRYQLLRQALLHLIAEQDPVTLSYLTGNRMKAFLHLLGILLDHKVLSETGEGNYTVHPENATAIPKLAAAVTGQLPEKVIFQEIRPHIEALINPIEKRFFHYKFTTNADEKYVMPVLILLTGIFRCAQGHAHQQPYGFLLAMMIMFAIAFLVLLRQTSFHKAAVSLTNEASPELTANEFDRMFIYSEVAALASLPLLMHLQYDTKLFGPNREPGSGPGGNCSSGCGSSCGSGCGSGCGGGCGGCGGD
jgi:hypothetical protein